MKTQPITNTPDQAASEREKVFAKNLKEILDFLDVNQSDFAKRVGCTQAAISQLVNGEREPSLKTIHKILEVIPCTFERLMRTP